MDGQKVVIIGGSSGLGLAIAEDCIDAGADVLIASRSGERCAELASGLGCNWDTLDLTHEEQVETFFQELEPFDHLVVTGVETEFGPFLRMETARARQFFNVKFWGSYFAARYGAPKMRKTGSILFFSGVASELPQPGLAVGGAINAGLEALTRSLAVELAPLRVNCLSPGPIDTPAWHVVPDKEKEAIFEAYAKRLPVGRMGTPQDIAQGALFLMQNTFSTGTILPVDGGLREAVLPKA